MAKDVNLRFIIVKEKTTSDPNFLVEIFTEDQVSALNGPRNNPRKVIAVGIADATRYGRVKVFASIKKIVVIANRLTGKDPGVVIHCHDPIADGTGKDKITEEIFTHKVNINTGEIAPNMIDEFQKGAMSQIFMDPTPDLQDDADAVELVRKAAIIPDSPSAAPGATTGKIDLSWRSVNPSSDPDKYSVYRSTTQGVTQETGEKVLDASQSSDDPVLFTDNGLTSGTTYFYVITATQPVGSNEPDRESLDSVEVSAVAT